MPTIRDTEDVHLSITKKMDGNVYLYSSQGELGRLAYSSHVYKLTQAEMVKLHAYLTKQLGLSENKKNKK